MGRKRLGRIDSGMDCYKDLCAVWFLRLTMEFFSAKSGMWLEIMRDDDCLRLLDIAPVDPEHELSVFSKSPVSVRRILLTLLRKLELKNPSLEDTALAENLHLLGQKLGFNQIEMDVVAFAVLIKSYSALSRAISTLNLNGSNQLVVQSLAAITKHNSIECHEVLGKDGKLARSGIVRLNKDMNDLEGKFNIPSGFGNVMLTSYDSEQQLLSQFFRQATEPSLTQADFRHLETDFRLVLRYLTRAMLAKAHGVNVLLYGPPGCGKTEFAKLLAISLKARLYEVSYDDDDGDSIRGEARLASYTLCQNMLANSDNTLVLFDEVEDVFPSSGMGIFRLFFSGRTEGKAGKAWVNRTLETNPVPTIWISNQVEQIDPAYLRRFDYALEMPAPPKDARLRIAHKHLDSTKVGRDWIARIADWSDITPAQLEKVARVTRLVNPRGKADAELVAERVLRGSVALLGQSRPPLGKKGMAYSLEYVNAGIELEPLVAELKANPANTFCFYGPPGTGKTALARYIAQAINQPLMVKRASEILGMYVGESEKNIAAMFREASQQNAVLVLDEADSLLQDRRGAHRSWEITQVNEMLAQMESFDGIFICTTNLLDRLDQASLRRFDYKVRFDCLRPEQRYAFFEKFWNWLNPDAGPPDAAAKCRLDRLDTLVPGDFAAVGRQRALVGSYPGAERLLDALEEECRFKERTSNPIGFLA